MKNYYVTKQKDGRWSLKGENAKRAVCLAETQQEAIERGRSLYGEHSIKIQGLDGKIRDESTYPRSADPFPPRG